MNLVHVGEEMHETDTLVLGTYKKAGGIIPEPVTSGSIHFQLVVHPLYDRMKRSIHTEQNRLFN